MYLERISFLIDEGHFHLSRSKRKREGEEGKREKGGILPEIFAQQSSRTLLAASSSLVRSFPYFLSVCYVQLGLMTQFHSGMPILFLFLSPHHKQQSLFLPSFIWCSFQIGFWSNEAFFLTVLLWSGRKMLLSWTCCYFQSNSRLEIFLNVYMCLLTVVYDLISQRWFF